MNQMRDGVHDDTPVPLNVPRSMLRARHVSTTQRGKGEPYVTRTVHETKGFTKYSTIILAWGVGWWSEGNQLHRG